MGVPYGMIRWKSRREEDTGATLLHYIYGMSWALEKMGAFEVKEMGTERM